MAATVAQASYEACTKAQVLAQELGPARHASRGCAPVLWVCKVPQEWPQVHAPPGVLRLRHALLLEGIAGATDHVLLWAVWSGHTGIDAVTLFLGVNRTSSV